MFDKKKIFQGITNHIEDSNSKKRISWGGIHVRCFNEQENKNWDVSPQSLLSNSDKSRSIDNNQVEDVNLVPSSNQRLSFFFNQSDGDILTAANNSNIGNNNNKQDQQQKDQEDGVNESGSFLLDDIDRLTRLSGLFKDFEDQFSKDDEIYYKKENTSKAGIISNLNFYQPFQQIPLPAKDVITQQLNEKKDKGISENQVHQIHKQEKDIQLKQAKNIQDANKMYSDPQSSQQQIIQSREYPKQQQQSWQQQQQLEQYQQGGQVKSIFDSGNFESSNNNFIPSSNKIIEAQVGTAQNSKRVDLPQFQMNDNKSKLQDKQAETLGKNALKAVSKNNQNSIQEDHQTNKLSDQQINYLVPIKNEQQYSRLSSFFNDEIKPDSQSTLQPKLQVKPQQQQNPYIREDSSESQNQGQKQFKFVLGEEGGGGGRGFQFDLFGMSGSNSGNESSSYLLENLDKVNGLNDDEIEQSNHILSTPNNSLTKKNLFKIPSVISPSPLVDDLKNLSLDFEERDDYYEDDQTINNKIKKNNSNNNNSKNNIIINKDKKKEQTMMKVELNKIKSADIFSNKAINSSKQKQEQQQQKQFVKKQLQNMSQLASPLHQSISNNLIQSIQRDQSNIKNKTTVSSTPTTQQSAFSSPKYKKNNFFFQGEENEQIQQKKLEEQSCYQSQDEEEQLLSSSSSHPLSQQDDEELEKIVIRMPLNSYEKKVILAALTPNKVNIDLFKYNQNTQDRNIVQQNDICNNLMDKVRSEYLSKINNCKQQLEQFKQKQQDLINQKEKQKQNILDANQQLESSQQSLNLIIQEREQNSIFEASQESKSKTMTRAELLTACDIIVNYFGYEYRAKAKDNHSSNTSTHKNDFIQFLILKQFLLLIQFNKQKLRDANNKSSRVQVTVQNIVIKPICHDNQSVAQNRDNQIEQTQQQQQQQQQSEQQQYQQMQDQQMISIQQMGRIVEYLSNEKYNQIEASESNIVKILQYITCSISNLISFNQQISILSSIHSIQDYDYLTKQLAFTVKLQHFPTKLIKFTLQPDQWYNDIQIKISGIDSDTTTITTTNQMLLQLYNKQNEEIDKQINTQFNTKINQINSFSKLRVIVDAINVKSSIQSLQNDTSSIGIINNSIS